MGRCSRCKGTGEAPDKITLECVECQSKVVITYHDTADLIAKSSNVVCAECRKVALTDTKGNRPMGDKP